MSLSVVVDVLYLRDFVIIPCCMYCLDYGIQNNLYLKVSRFGGVLLHGDEAVYIRAAKSRQGPNS